MFSLPKVELGVWQSLIIGMKFMSNANINKDLYLALLLSHNDFYDLLVMLSDSGLLRPSIILLRDDQNHYVTKELQIILFI